MEDEQVAPQDEAHRNSPKTAARDGAEKTVAAEDFCYWNDKKYSDGATVCDNKRRYECWNGKWVDIGNC